MTAGVALEVPEGARGGGRGRERLEGWEGDC